MTRAPEDDACENCLLDMEAERQDKEARQWNQAWAELRPLVDNAIRIAAAPKVNRAKLNRVLDALVLQLMREFAYRGNDWQAMVIRQARERAEVFAKRSGKKLVIQPITKARIAERQAAIEEARKVEDKT